MRSRPSFAFVLFVLLSAPAILTALPQKAADSASAKESILKPADIGEKLLPDKVFFRGQIAPTQARNSSAVRYADGFLILAALVDSSGYSTGIKEKYQAYLITEVPMEIGGQTLKPGAYGCGFVEGNKFLVMDVGANDVLSAASTKDAELRRPVPLQIVAGATTGNYRLYHGRDYVEFHRAK
jgi:hypothetical protein